MSMLANLVPAMRHGGKHDRKTGKETRDSKTGRRRRRGSNSRH
ncbi:hypothetical protein AB0C76_16755 [Kitasatospora sp. NPDC048722]